MHDVIQIPVLPLRDSVLFPGSASPISAGRPLSLAAVKEAASTPEKWVLTVAQRSDREDVSVENLYKVGTLGQLGTVHWSKTGAQMLIQARHRVVVLRYETRGEVLWAHARRVEETQPLDPADPAFVALVREVRQEASEVAQRVGLPAEVAHRFLDGVQEPGGLADLVAGYIELKTPEKQLLLEIADVESRLRALLVHLQRYLQILDAQQDIKTKVQQELGDRQREILLREQMKAIQSELGEDQPREELEELKKKLDALELSPAVRKEVDRELKRLSRMGQESLESQQLRSYLETIAELPWNELSEGEIDLGVAAKALEDDHFGLDDVKDRVLEYLAVLQMQQKRAASKEDEKSSKSTKKSRSPILLFSGPPGVGKTSVAQSIARSMGREYVRVSLGGVRDEADIRGHRRTYVGALPGRIIQGMRQAGTRNPVFLLDEVDKLGVSHQGDPASALLEVLDPEQNHTFVDHYLGVPFDLSEVLFIATANLVHNIPPPLLDRMEVVEFKGYTEAQKVEIATRYLVPRQIERNGLSPAQLALEPDAVREVVTRYTREAGVRQLEQSLGKVARKVARRIASGDTSPVTVDRAEVARILGRPRIHPERVANEDQVGVSTGMYYTPVGGDIMFIEAITMPGRGELVLTGQLGDVMKESARAAWSYARAHASQLRVPPETFQRDLHIHVPAGAIPKDGPSAGVAMATAMVSTLSGIPVRRDVAMTGEVTLTGRVLPVGGIKEKVLGALRAGMRKILLPRTNEADLDDLTPDAREALEFRLVDTLDDVLAEALTLPLPGPAAVEEPLAGGGARILPFAAPD